MLRIESLSVYCNPTVHELVGSTPGLADAAPYTWRNDMKRGLETFSINSEEFEFSKYDLYKLIHIEITLKYLFTIVLTNKNEHITLCY